MYKIEITADSLSELAGRALALAVQLRGATDPVMPEVRYGATPAPTAGPVSATVTVAPEPAPEPAAAPEPVAAPEPEQAPEPAPEQAADTAERLRTLILATVATKGRETVAAMLEQFGVARGSQLSPEQAAEMIGMLS
jgi:fused signal recognition particle receptor